MTDLLVDARSAILQTEAHHSAALSDVRDDCGTGLDSWREIVRSVWISRPTSDLVLARL